MKSLLHPRYDQTYRLRNQTIYVNWDTGSLSDWTEVISSFTIFASVKLIWNNMAICRLQGIQQSIPRHSAELFGNLSEELFITANSVCLYSIWLVILVSLCAKNWNLDPRNKLHTITHFHAGSFTVYTGDHLPLGIIWGPIWGSFPVLGSFAVGDHGRLSGENQKPFWIVPQSAQDVFFWLLMLIQSKDITTSFEKIWQSCSVNCICRSRIFQELRLIPWGDRITEAFSWNVAIWKLREVIKMIDFSKTTEGFKWR